MKALIVGLLIGIAFAASPVAALGRAETLRVQVNKEKRFPKSKLTIRFVELVDDSRCPTDTNCIWAGNGKIKVSVKAGNGAAKVFEMDTNGTNKTVSHGGYRITLKDLTPHPRSTIRINRNGYIATLEAQRMTR